MPPGPHVFGDGRLGCYMIQVGNATNQGRLARLKVLGITDILLRGPDGTSAAKQSILSAGFTGVGAWWAVDDLTAVQYGDRCLADIGRWQPGFGDLNVELASDPPLEPYMRTAVSRIRVGKPNYRLRFNVAARKGVFLPIDLLQLDPNLYCAIQNYGGNMDFMFSAADNERQALRTGVPSDKIASCYAGACTVGGKTGLERVNTYPLGWRPERGVVFSDDLLEQAGLL